MELMFVWKYNRLLTPMAVAIAPIMTSKIVATAVFILISLTGLIPLGCNQEIPTELVQHQFEVGNQSLTISLPSEFQRDPNVPFIQFLRPEYRVARSLHFTADPPILDSPRQTTRLRQGGELSYNILTYSGGSGGIEAELFGHIVLNETTIGVTATDQDEFSPNPEWCIEYLHTLHPIPYR